MLRIQGEAGRIEFPHAYDNGGAGVTITGKVNVEETSPAKGRQLGIEAEHLADCIRNHTEPRSPGEEGLRDHEAFTAIYKAAGIVHA